MNKYETALLRLMCLDDGEEKDALNIVAELVERATPKKPYKIFREDDLHSCPNRSCEGNVQQTVYDYIYGEINILCCPYCGQALDWNEEE